MTSSRPLRRALGLGLATLLASSAVSVGSPAQGEPPDRPDYEQPGVGECRVLTYDGYLAESDPSAPVACDEPHTSYVVAVGQLPAEAGWDDPLARLSRVATATCIPAWEDHLGGTERAREMSAYAVAWFMPTPEQRERGARWFRCDVVLLGGSRVLALPGDAAPVLDTELPDSVARCLTRAPAVTTCERNHVWRATGASRLRTDDFPTAREWQRTAERRCPALTSTRRWRWEGPGRDAWRVGHRTLVCYSRTPD